MNPNKSFYKKLKTFPGVFLGSVFLLGSPVVHAELPHGTYEDASKNTFIYVKTFENSGVATTYGIIYSKAGSFGSVYRVEPVDDYQTAWVQVYQSADNLLTLGVDQSPRFLGSLYSEKNQKEKRLKLIPSEQEGQTSSSGALDGKRTGKSYWDWTPSQPLRSSKKDAKVYLDGKSLKADVKLTNGGVVSGDFEVTEFIPGILQVRASKYDAEAFSGKSFSRQIVALIAVFKENDFGLKTRLKFISLKPANREASKTETLDFYFTDVNPE